MKEHDYFNVTKDGKRYDELSVKELLSEILDRAPMGSCSAANHISYAALEIGHKLFYDHKYPDEWL